MHFRTSAALIVLAIAFSQASAETIKIEAVGVDASPALSIKMFYDDDGPGPWGGGSKTMMVGQYNWRPATGSNNNSPFNQYFSSFCIDIDSSNTTSGTFNVVRLEDGPDISGIVSSGGTGVAGSTSADGSMST